MNGIATQSRPEVDAQELELSRTTEVSRDDNVINNIAQRCFWQELSLRSEDASIQMAQF